MRKIHGFLNRGAGRDHADIDLLLSRKPQPSDNAGAQVDQRSIHARHWCEGIPHPDSIGEDKANVAAGGIEVARGFSIVLSKADISVLIRLR